MRQRVDATGTPAVRDATTTREGADPSPVGCRNRARSGSESKLWDARSGQVYRTFSPAGAPQGQTTQASAG